MFLIVALFFKKFTPNSNIFWFQLFMFQISGFRQKRFYFRIDHFLEKIWVESNTSVPFLKNNATELNDLNNIKIYNYELLFKQILYLEL